MAMAAEPLPLGGIAHVAFRVSSLDKAREFYVHGLGMPEAAQLKSPDGAVSLLFLQVNDEQFIEISPSLRGDQHRRLSHISFITFDLGKARQMVMARGLQPSIVTKGRDGNQSFRLEDPEGNTLEFTEYMPGSLHWNARGQFAEAPRVSQRIMHAGIVITDMDRMVEFYHETLGFEEFWRGGPADDKVAWINMRVPGSHGDYVELMVLPKVPTREQLGSAQHLCLMVPDIEAAHRTMAARLTLTDRNNVKRGRNRKMQFNLYDPDGSRTELMEPAIRE